MEKNFLLLDHMGVQKVGKAWILKNFRCHSKELPSSDTQYEFQTPQRLRCFSRGFDRAVSGIAAARSSRTEFFALENDVFNETAPRLSDAIFLKWANFGLRRFK